LNDAEGASLILHDVGGEKRQFVLDAGGAFLVPAGVHFDCRCTASSVGHFYVHFEVTGLPGMLLRELFNRPLCLPPLARANGSASEIVAELKDSGGARTEDLALFCRTKSLLYDSLAASLRDMPNTDRERYSSYADLLAPVLHALEIIENRFAEPITNAVLADACHFSEDYFIRRFKECVGEPPAQYIQHRRIDIAANRLLFSADSIERIAAECGFGNRFHFTRVFTSRMGIAPAAYRKEGRV
jgi:AraC-like DNA-binding protein